VNWTTSFWPSPRWLTSKPDQSGILERQPACEPGFSRPSSECFFFYTACFFLFPSCIFWIKLIKMLSESSDEEDAKSDRGQVRNLALDSE
jgi:hypothetical protein